MPMTYVSETDIICKSTSQENTEWTAVIQRTICRQLKLGPEFSLFLVNNDVIVATFCTVFCIYCVQTIVYSL
jgi:hypothetical protein